MAGLILLIFQMVYNVMVICETIATLGTKNGNIQHSEQVDVHKSGQQNTWDDLSFHKNRLTDKHHSEVEKFGCAVLQGW